MEKRESDVAPAADPETLNRSRAIELLRAKLTSMTEEDHYHLGRQEVTGAAICCDAETREHCACDGWNTFDNKTLEEFCLALTGRPVKIG